MIFVFVLANQPSRQLRTPAGVPIVHELMRQLIENSRRFTRAQLKLRRRSTKAHATRLCGRWQYQPKSQPAGQLKVVQMLIQQNPSLAVSTKSRGMSIPNPIQESCHHTLWPFETFEIRLPQWLLRRPVIRLMTRTISATTSKK